VSQHLLLDDLDLLGPAFQRSSLLSTSRTATGDRILAQWLLARLADIVKAGRRRWWSCAIRLNCGKTSR